MDFVASDEKLKQGLKQQLVRLMKQLADVEEFKSEMTEEEYEQAKQETMQQLAVFDDTLTSISSGHTTLVDELTTMKATVKAAISEAFHTPAVIRLLAEKQPAQLRYQLEVLERDNKAGLLPMTQFLISKREMLIALRDLGDKLSPEELRLLSSDSSELTSSFQPVKADDHKEKLKSIIDSGDFS